MPKTVSASEAKTQFGAMMDWAAETQDEVIVQSHGQPKAVNMSFKAYQAVAQLREETRVGPVCVPVCALCAWPTT